MSKQEKFQCANCKVFLRDYLESISKNPFFSKHLDECVELFLDLTRYITRSSIYGGKARANLYMKCDNLLYYSFVFKVVKGNTSATRLEKELHYLRLWLLEHTFLKSDNKSNPFEQIDFFLESSLIRILDTVYEIHEAHTHPHMATMIFVPIDEDDWSDYDSIC